ncbi:MAG TPA: SDR family oxidoreductase [Myxococcaceae bacterium]|nr:SDR family oxidoreductase [Myxococcaceae bacterium]
MRKNILITGASSGLGEGMAREFAARGRNLALCARRTDRLDALKAELLAKHPGIQVSVRALDVNDHAQVFSVFDAFAQELGSLDRIIVNAGVGQGKRVGTGHFATNVQTAQTNFIAAIAQCEAAVGILRKQQQGHLVTVSSMSAMRGLPKHLTVYAATKAGLSSLTEGIRAELLGTPIKVSILFPGYIRTELNAGAKKLPFEVDAVTGSRAMVKAIEREPVRAYVPRWPWVIGAFFMRNLPLPLVAKMI